MLWCPGPPLSPARTSSPASPLSRPSMAEPVRDLQPWFMARVRGLYPHLPGTRPPCTQQYTRPPCWYLSRPPSISPPCWTAMWAAPCTRPPLLVRPTSGCCQSPQLQEMSRRQEVFLPELLSPSFLPHPPVFCLPKSPSRGPWSVATLLCLCTSTEVQRCSLETCVASCQPNHAGQQQTCVCGAVRCHSCSVVTS